MAGEVAVQIVTTVTDKAAGVRLARGLLEKRLAACVQIDGPLESLYRWQGQIEQGTEWRLTIKTTHQAAESAIATLRSEHSYDEPEILVLPVSGGSMGYLEWLRSEVGAEESP